MNTARQRMLERNRLFTIDADHLRAEASALIVQAHAALDYSQGKPNPAGQGLVPDSIKDRLADTIGSLEGVIKHAEEARNELAGDESIVAAISSLRDALKALGTAKHNAPDPRPTPHTTPGVAMDSAVEYGPGVRFAQGAEGAVQQAQYRLLYQDALRKCGGDREVAALIAASKYRVSRRATLPVPARRQPVPVRAVQAPAPHQPVRAAQPVQASQTSTAHADSATISTEHMDSAPTWLDVAEAAWLQQHWAKYHPGE